MTETVPARFQAMVARAGDAPAMHFKAGGRWVPISWKEYGRAVSRFSNGLLQEGLQMQERVAIWAGNRPEWQIADLGIMHAGGATVAIYSTLSVEQVCYLLVHSEARVLVVESRRFLDQVVGLRERLPALRRVVLMEGDLPEQEGWVISWTDALRRGDELSRYRPGLFDSRWQAIRGEDMATLIYTSGTTGTPKGAILTHHNLTWTMDSVQRYLPGKAEDRMVSYLPLAHILERMVSELRQVETGCQVYFCPSIDLLIPVLREVRPTFVVAVPRVLEKMYAGIRNRLDRVRGPRRAIRDFALRAAARATDAFERRATGSPWRSWQWRIADRLVFRAIRANLGLDRATWLGSTAAPISPQILRFLWGLGLRVVEIYGQTEVSGPTTGNYPDDVRLGTVGRAFPGVLVQIAEDGEVLVRGDNVSQGYFKDQVATAELLQDGWLHSGDIGRLDEDGFLTITDRKKDLFKTSGGKYVAPGAIENLLKSRRGISQAVVLGDSRPYVAALLTLDDDIPETRGGIEDPAVKRLVDVAIAEVNRDLSHPEQIKRWRILPGDFVVGDELTPTMKVKRKVVNEKYRATIESLYADARAS